MASQEDTHEQTIFASSHGGFIHCLICLVNGNPQDHDSLKYAPHNNSLTIIDFNWNPYNKGQIDTRLTAANLQVIENCNMARNADFLPQYE